MPAPTTFKYLPARLADRLHDCEIAPSGAVAGRGQGRHRSRLHGASVEFADYREYVPGDPPARIDWSVYARSDRHLIRRFEDETTLRVHVLLDTSESMAYRGEESGRKIDHACHLAAGLLFVAVRQGDAAALHTFTDAIAATHPLARSFAALRPQLHALEGLAVTGRSTVEKVLHAFAEERRERGLVVVVSDLLEDAAGVLNGIRHLIHAGHHAALVHVMDRSELALGFDGVVEIAELETGRRLVVEVDEFRAAYAEQVQLHLEALRHGCAAAGAAYHLADTAVPADAAVRAAARAL